MGHDQQEVHAKGGADVDVDLDAKRQHEELTKDWEWVKGYADGKHSQNDLSKHIAELGGWTSEAIGLMPKIAKRTSGDIVLDCAARLGMPLVEQIKLARHQSKTPVGADALRDHLRQLAPQTLAELDADPDLIHELRTKLLKEPLSVELPVLAQAPGSIVGRVNIMEWYVETMNPAIGGIQLATSGNAKKLANTLDKLADKTPKAWGWLSSINIQNLMVVGDGLVALKAEAKNDAALQKLAALTKNYEPDVEKQTKQVPAAAKEFEKQLDGKDDPALLDAAARSQGEGSDNAKLPARLAGAPADTVLQYLFTISSMTAADVKRSLGFLTSAKGTTAEHLSAFFSTVTANNIAGALADDTTRKNVRAIVGRGRSLHSLFAMEGDESAHSEIVKDEALRKWAYEDPSPGNMLWLAAGSGPGAKLGCRLVKSEKGNDWVEKLPADADGQDLRRFVLNSTDAAAVSHIKSTFLKDAKHSVDDERENKAVATSGTVYGGKDLTGKSMTEARPTLLGDEADPQVVLARLADLNASERKHILAKPDDVAKVFGQLYGFELRAVELLQPSIEQLAQLPIKNRPDLVDYTSTRASGEQSDGAWYASALQTRLGAVSPFIALPALKQPDTLAKALDDNEPLLDWILQETDASQALALLSREPARKVVAGLMSNGRHAYSGLPAYEQLRKQGKDGFDAIAKDIKDDDTKDEAKDYKSGDAKTEPDADKHAKDVKHATAVGNLPANIDAIIDAGGSSKDVIAVVQAATPQQQIELLSGEHTGYVKRLRAHVKVGPQHVFPDLSAAQLLSLWDGASWLLAHGEPTTALHLITNNAAATSSLGKLVSKNFELGISWADSLPRGPSLTASERRAVDDLAGQVTNDVVLHKLFDARFDVTIGANYSFDETTNLWTVLKRLPHAQVDQEVIKNFTKQPLNGPIGQWGKPDIDLDTPKLTGNDSHYERSVWMTADEVKKYYNLDDKKLKEAVDGTKAQKGWLQFENGLYKVKMTEPRQFDATVLHEVGHSVDTLLGDHTELIYGESYAGWKRYGYDQFEQFASEMGAFDHVNGTERKQIVDAWQQSLRSKTAVERLVPQDHPAITKPSPLQKFVGSDEPFLSSNHELKPVNNKMFVQTPTALASLAKRGWDAAPTDYAMTSPAEFFAECYVEYYCRYDGTKDSDANKGGRLPSWIKKWFDDNVDAIRFSPERVHKGMDDKSS